MDRLVRWCQRIVRRKSRRHLIQRQNSTNGSQFRLLELPLDLQELTLEFLTGFDLVPLSHASRQLYFGLLACDAEIWQRLAPLQPPSPPLQTRVTPLRRALWLRFQRAVRSHANPSPKQRYFDRRSIRFHGGTYPRECGAVPTPTLEETAGGGSLSFDLVFALLPECDPILRRTDGAILLGAQSTSVNLGIGAILGAQYVRVDAEANLYCSVTSEKAVVAQRLAYKRWYHVALVFEVTAPVRGTQRVYLDGELVHTSQGWFHDGMSTLSNAQLGIGYDSRGGHHLVHHLVGWRPLNGLVDECRFWSGVLSPDEVRRLASGRSVDKPAHAARFWSMRDNITDRSACGLVDIVHSTSPAERVVHNLKTTQKLPASPIFVIRDDMYISVYPHRRSVPPPLDQRQEQQTRS